MTKNAAVVTMHATVLAFVLIVFFGVAYLAVTYSIWWLLALAVIPTISLPNIRALER